MQIIRIIEGFDASEILLEVKEIDNIFGKY